MQNAEEAEKGANRAIDGLTMIRRSGARLAPDGSHETLNRDTNSV